MVSVWPLAPKQRLPEASWLWNVPTHVPASEARLSLRAPELAVAFASSHDPLAAAKSKRAVTVHERVA